MAWSTDGIWSGGAGGSETFGYTSKGASTDYNYNVVDGSLFTTGTHGGAIQSITAYVKFHTLGFPIKFACYKHSDLSLIAYTAAWNITAAYDDWKTLLCTAHPTLAPLTEYVLCFWTDDQIDMYYAAGVANQRHQDAEVYGANFPDPLVPGHSAREWSIYATCTY